MGMVIGSTSWWQANLVAVCPVGTALPDGSRIIYKSAGRSWIVTPIFNTSWGNFSVCGNFDNPGTDLCCASAWSSLTLTMLSGGFNSCDWFIPTYIQFTNIAYACRFYWNYNSSINYWTSSEYNNICGGRTSYAGCRIVFPCCEPKSTVFATIGMRCVTY